MPPHLAVSAKAHPQKWGHLHRWGGASKSGLTQQGSRRASQFCDSAIRQTGQGVVIEIHSILRAFNTSAILRRSMAVSQIDPLAACVDADTFLCWGGGCPILGILFFPTSGESPSPISWGIRKPGYTAQHIGL